jgi:hypothetical protein
MDSNVNISGKALCVGCMVYALSRVLREAIEQVFDTLLLCNTTEFLLVEL